MTRGCVFIIDLYNYMSAALLSIHMIIFLRNKLLHPRLSVVFVLLLRRLGRKFKLFASIYGGDILV